MNNNALIEEILAPDYIPPKRHPAKVMIQLEEKESENREVKTPAVNTAITEVKTSKQQRYYYRHREEILRKKRARDASIRILKGENI